MLNINTLQNSDSSTLASVITNIYQSLRAQEDLSPRNALVNQGLSTLVSQLIKNYDLSGQISLPEEERELPKLCGNAECEMEIFWAKKFLAMPKLTSARLPTFWYYKNYQALWQQEADLLTKTPQHIVFLGSGALPLTAIMAAQQFAKVQVTCVDADPIACDLSRQLIGALGLSEQIKVVENYAQDVMYEPDDLVICASLIEGKAALYDTLHSAGVKQFMVRDAEGVYRFLYAPAPLPEVAHYEQTRTTHPNPLCINTTRVFAARA